MEVDNGGVRINLEVEGPEDAPALLLIHGLSGSLEYWRWLPERITVGRRVLRMDMRGHGRSDRTPGAYQVPGYASDAVAVLEQLATRPAVVVGHSLGGVVAWTVTQQRPDLVAGAVLEDPPLYFGEAQYFPGSVAEVYFPVLREHVIEWQAEGIDHETWVRRIGFAPSGAKPDITLNQELTDDAVDARATALSLLDPDAVLAASSLETLEPTDTVSPVTPPVLLLRAEEALGPALGPAQVERLRRTHPGVEIVEMHGAGHYISVSRAAQDRFGELLAEFLDTHAPVG